MILKTIVLVGFTTLLWAGQPMNSKTEIASANNLINSKGVTQTNWTCPNDCHQIHDRENCPYDTYQHQGGNHSARNQGTEQGSRRASGNCHCNNNN